MRLLPTKAFVDKIFDRKVDTTRDESGRRYVTGYSLRVVVEKGEFIEATVRDKDGEVMFRASLLEEHFNCIDFPQVAINLEMKGFVA